MKKTLLELTQDILNDLDSDGVNSIDDTVEAGQVAQIIRTTYEELLSNRNWPHTKKLVQLEASGSLAKPNYLVVPELLKELVILKYDKIKADETKLRIESLTYKYPDEFLDIVLQRNSDSDNVETIEDFSGTRLLILNDQAPTYWTSFDDKYIVTDSYDKTVDSTLKKSKTQCLAYMFPVWEHVDDFIPDLPAEAFMLLLEEAKSTASMKLKQVADQKAEQKSKRQNRWLSRKAWSAAGGVRYADFGRKGRR